jgi:hypothetical protein
MGSEGLKSVKKIKQTALTTINKLKVTKGGRGEENSSLIQIVP